MRRWFKRLAIAIPVLLVLAIFASALSSWLTGGLVERRAAAGSDERRPNRFMSILFGIPRIPE